MPFTPVQARVMARISDCTNPRNLWFSLKLIGISLFKVVEEPRDSKTEESSALVAPFHFLPVDCHQVPSNSKTSQTTYHFYVGLFMPNAFFPTVPLWIVLLVFMTPFPVFATMEEAPPEVEKHLLGIASHAKPSPTVIIPEGWFLMGTNRQDHLRHSFEIQYDDTEFPQRRIWLDTFEIDQYEVTLGEVLSF